MEKKEGEEEGIKKDTLLRQVSIASEFKYSRLNK